jgi:hypothetical protein
MDDLPTDFNSLIALVSGIYDINIQNILEKLISFYDEAAQALEIPFQAIADELNRFYNLTCTLDEISFEGALPSFDTIANKLDAVGISLADVINDFNLAGVITDPDSAADVIGSVINKHIYNLVETLNTNYSLSPILLPNIILLLHEQSKLNHNDLLARFRKNRTACRHHHRGARLSQSPKTSLQTEDRFWRIRHQTIQCPDY